MNADWVLWIHLAGTRRLPKGNSTMFFLMSQLLNFVQPKTSRTNRGSILLHPEQEHRVRYTHFAALSSHWSSCPSWVHIFILASPRFSVWQVYARIPPHSINTKYYFPCRVSGRSRSTASREKGEPLQSSGVKSRRSGRNNPRKSLRIRGSGRSLGFFV